MTLACKGTCAPVVPPFKGKGGSAPVMHSRCGVPESYLYIIEHIEVADEFSTSTNSDFRRFFI